MANKTVDNNNNNNKSNESSKSIFYIIFNVICYALYGAHV